jgi:group I intron endonuclease
MDKKELKKQYKQTLTQMGVYQIKNLVNGKIFIGSAKNLPGKLNSNKFQLEHKSHINHELQKDYIELGEKNFVFELLDELEPKEEDPAYDYTRDLKALENMWLEKLQPFGDKGYNKISELKRN